MYNIGDIVRIRKDSEYYTDNRYNPKDVDGMITEKYSGPDIKYEVEWENGVDNYYPHEALELVTQKQTINNNYKLY